MANVFIRLVEKVGEKTVTSAEMAARRVKESSIAIREQDQAVERIKERKEKEREERDRLVEDKLKRLRESVTLEEIPEEEEGKEEIIPEREELEVPFSVRLSTIISDFFSAYTAKPSSFFKNIQEDLYRANILMPASKYIGLAIGISVIVAVISGVATAVLGGLLLGGVGTLLGVVVGPMIGGFALVFSRIYPQKKVRGRSDDFSGEIPFALRHMATMLSSGSGLLETMRSLGNSNYGVLSEEFKRALMEVERGATIEEAYDRINLRIDSPGFQKASRQIVSTLKTGGNLADTLKAIAEDSAREMRMKLKDFIQVLNTFSLMYMFLTVVAPVLITILVIAMSFATKAVLLSPQLMWVIYLVFFGAAVYMSIMIKRFEPKV